MIRSLHSPHYEHFRRLLVKAREDAGITQAQVSAKLGRPQSFVAKYEGGERRLDVIEFVQVCTALGIEPQGIIADIQQNMQ